jgi:hypothetical protein
LKLLDGNCAQIGTRQERLTSQIPPLPKSQQALCQKVTARNAAKMRCGYPLEAGEAKAHERSRLFAVKQRISCACGMGIAV